MKREFLCFMFTLGLASSAMAQHSFQISGKITGLDGERKVMFGYPVTGKYVVDSMITKNGEFRFTGIVNVPVKANIELKSVDMDTTEMTMEKYMARDVREFFIDSAAIIHVTGTGLKGAVVTGGKTQSEFLKLSAAQKPMEDSIAALMPQMQAVEQESAAHLALIEKARGFRSEIEKIEEEFIRTNRGSFVSLDLLEDRAAVIDVKTFEPLFNSLSAEIKSSSKGKYLAGALASAQKTEVGKEAINFTQNTTDGKPFTLASLKGKYVLVDFWASWCGPCRAENPNVVKAYQQFRDRNFEIVGVSLDDNKTAWVNAIAKDQLPWIHVSDLKGWNNEVAALYAVRAVPQNVLLDKKGVIIAKNLRGEELANRLSELIR